MDVQLFSKNIFMHTAALAAVLIAVSCVAALLHPVLTARTRRVFRFPRSIRVLAVALNNVRMFTRASFRAVFSLERLLHAKYLAAFLADEIHIGFDVLVSTCPRAVKRIFPIFCAACLEFKTAFLAYKQLPLFPIGQKTGFRAMFYRVFLQILRTSVDRECFLTMFACRSNHWHCSTSYCV